MTDAPQIHPFHPPKRVLLGPGPSDVHQRVLDAMARPTLGHLDPKFCDMMEEMKTLLRYAFQTENQLTFPLSAPGSAGMESCLPSANCHPPGCDRASRRLDFEHEDGRPAASIDWPGRIASTSLWPGSGTQSALPDSESRARHLQKVFVASTNFTVSRSPLSNTIYAVVPDKPN